MGKTFNIFAKMRESCLCIIFAAERLKKCLDCWDHLLLGNMRLIKSSKLDKLCITFFVRFCIIFECQVFNFPIYHLICCINQIDFCTTSQKKSDDCSFAEADSTNIEQLETQKNSKCSNSRAKIGKLSWSI